MVQACKSLKNAAEAVWLKERIRTHSIRWRKYPKMTKAQAMLIVLMESYSVAGYRLSELEIHKLAYLLQEMGEPLELTFRPDVYGPYSDDLDHVLQSMEGNFIRGYGDRRKDGQVSLLPHASDTAQRFLSRDNDSMDRLTKVRSIIDGFETPYGMELLSIVHWVCRRESNIMQSPNNVVSEVHKWNPRKRRVFKLEHVTLAIGHLTQTQAL